MKDSRSEFLFLMAASISCGILLLIRIIYWQQIDLDLADLSTHGILKNKGKTFLFLIWNLFLAWIPYMISYFLPWFDKMAGRKFRLLTGLLLIVWLLFFPNAPYIITDLLHLKPRPAVPLWFDLILLLSFAWVGLLFGIFSLLHIQKWVQIRFNKNYDSILAVTLIPLCSLGVYLGRFLRWNSWEVFTQPQILLADLYYLITDMDALSTAMATIGCFSLLLFLFYLPFKTLQKK